MKPFFFFLFLSAVFLYSCNEKKGMDPLDYKLSEKEALADIDLFKTILDSAHPSLTIYKNRKTLDFLFDSIRNSIKGPVSLSSLYNNLFYISNEIGCSHTEVHLPDYAYDTLQNRSYFFPYPVLWVEDKLLVNATDLDLPEGTEIVSLNGVPAKQLLKDMSFYNSVEGFHRNTQLIMASKDFSFQYYLKNGPKDIFSMEIVDTSGKKKTISEGSISLAGWTDRNSYYKYYFDGVSVDFDLKIDDNKGYAMMRIPTFEYSSFQKQEAFEHFCSNSFELLENKKNIRRLIIDLRENTGGRLNNAFRLFSHLTKKPFIEFEYVSSKIRELPFTQYLDKNFAASELATLNTSIPDEFVKNKNGAYYYADSLNQKWPAANHRFDGQVYVITNSSTASAASYFALMVKNSGVGKLVGVETSGGAYSGNGFRTLEYVLPNSRIKLLFPYAHLVYSFKESKNTGRGIIPDYIVPDTYESFKNNDDKQGQYIMDSLFLN